MTSFKSFRNNPQILLLAMAILGLVWLASPTLVFFIGAGFACCSLLLALNISHLPIPGNEVIRNHFSWANESS